MTRVVFLLAPYLHLLDLAGPAQVFSTAADFGYGYELHYVGERPDIPSTQGVPLQAGVRWPDITPADLIMVPGWRARRRDAGHFSRSTLSRLVEHHAAGGTVASVCSGAAALGRAGLLSGRRFTTHHEIQDDLAARYPGATLVKDVLFVSDERVLTSAGIASGIDLALHLVATRHGPSAAAQVARSMVVYARRNGDEPQASAMLRYRSHLNDVVHRAQDLIDARFDAQLVLSDLAAAFRVGERTLTRGFVKATGLTPLRYQQLLRLERAEHLIGHGATVEAAARSVGFADARMLRRLRARGGPLTLDGAATKRPAVRRQVARPMPANSPRT